MINNITNFSFYDSEDWKNHPMDIRFKKAGVQLVVEERSLGNDICSKIQFLDSIQFSQRNRIAIKIQQMAPGTSMYTFPPSYSPDAGNHLIEANKAKLFFAALIQEQQEDEKSYVPLHLFEKILRKLKKKDYLTTADVEGLRSTVRVGATIQRKEEFEANLQKVIDHLQTNEINKALYALRPICNTGFSYKQAIDLESLFKNMQTLTCDVIFEEGMGPILKEAINANTITAIKLSKEFVVHYKGLAKFLRESTSITSIDLTPGKNKRSGSLDQTDLDHLSSALKVNTSLLELNLNYRIPKHNTITPAQALQTILTSLRQNPNAKLQTIHLL